MLFSLMYTCLTCEGQYTDCKSHAGKQLLRAATNLFALFYHLQKKKIPVSTQHTHKHTSQLKRSKLSVCVPITKKLVAPFFKIFSNTIYTIHLDWIAVTRVMSAFDTDKPAGICSISMKTPVGEPVEDFVEFYIPVSCLIKSIAVVDASSPFCEFHRIRHTLRLHLAFHHSLILSPPVEIMYSMDVVYAGYGSRYTPNN